MSEKLRLQEPIRSPLETPRLITPLPYRSGTSFLAWAIVNNNQPVPDVFSKMTKIAASGRLGQLGRLLPEKPSWSASLRIWGDEKADDIQVGINGQAIEDIRFRLNVADLSLPLVGGICDFARHFDSVLATPEGAIIQPSREAVMRTIMQSQAAQYVRDPQRFLDEAIRLDREGR